MSKTPTAAAYLSELAARVGRLMEQNAEAIAAAAAAVERTAKADGLVYIFGTGHSHTMAEEAHYRAGGLAFTVPILSTPLMVHEGAVASTAFERMSGVIVPVFEHYPMDANDVLIVVSNSGVNAATVEAAQLGKQRGATVVAITSQDYSRQAAHGRTRLADVADIVLDNGAPPGDAIMRVPGGELRVGPISTSIGAALMNAVFAEVAVRLQSSGADAPVYLSANMPGAKEVNEGLIARYRKRNRHL
ncbi:MAG: SIS domain-containing protein [Mesorhizobium sp.]|uniref:SIS domain-containing protein n=1 Tax=Mesorhizobium sp. TaxID=1871066 RepID=UPI001ACAC122|nr:SIS domain-containing protein [Mesorhizobium sp.]MBN9221982.1 SIS domain-containing protein [Mesorhizobium sp.]